MRTVIVTGSREWADPDRIYKALFDARPSLVIQGGCHTGADMYARAWARVQRVPCKSYDANWQKHGRRAGPLRNGLMLRSHPDALVLAFPLDGPGTKDCVRQAKRAGMHVIEFPPAPAGVTSIDAARRRKNGDE